MTVSTPPLQPAPRPQPSPGWGPGRILAAIAASLFLLLGTGMLITGGVLRLVDGPIRDDQGYVMGSTETWESPGYAVQSESAEIHLDSTLLDLPGELLGTMKATADPATPNGVFIGVARTTDVLGYLRGVAHSTIVDPVGNHRHPMMPMSTFVDGGSPSVAPTDASFWEASSSGLGEQTITWEPRNGSWTLVVMNGEGTTPVAADVAVGAEVPVLGAVGTFLLVGGVVVLVLSGAGLWLTVRRR